MEPLCQTCKYWHIRGTRNGEEDLNECRFNPPIIVEVTRWEGEGDYERANVKVAWPTTFGRQGCGRYEARI